MKWGGPLTTVRVTTARVTTGFKNGPVERCKTKGLIKFDQNRSKYQRCILNEISTPPISVCSTDSSLYVTVLYEIFRGTHRRTHVHAQLSHMCVCSRCVNISNPNAMPIWGIPCHTTPGIILHLFIFHR